MDVDSLLAACLSHEDQIRKPAEEAIRSLASKPEVVAELLKRVQHASEAQIRHLAAVLLRKYISRHWLSLNSEAQKTAQAMLLHSIAQEPVQMVRRAVADVVAAVAKHTVPKNQWPELLGTLQQWSQGSSAEHRELALIVFSSLAEMIGEHMAAALPTLIAIISGGLGDPNHNVRHAALRAIEPLVSLVDTEAHVTAFHGLVGQLLECAKDALRNNNQEEGVKCFQLLVDACEAPAPLLATHVPAVIQLAAEAAAAKQLDIETRDQALQVITVLASNKPKQLTKNKELVKQVLNVLFAMTCEEPEGGPGVKPEPGTPVPRSLAGQALDSLALSIPTQHVGPEALAFARTAMSSGNPSDRQGAQVVLAVICEGGAVWLRKRMEDVLPLVMAGLKDGSSHVRAAAAFTVGQMAEFMPNEVVEHHADILPAILAVMSSESDPDLQERAAYAVDTFCEALEPEEIAPYMGQVVGQLVRVLERGAHVSHAGVQEVALSALASTAAAARQDFAQYAEGLLPALAHFMAATNTDMLHCRCKATEVMGVMLEHLCGPTANGAPGPLAGLVPQVMEVSLAGWQLGYTELREYSHSLWASIAKGLGEGFAPYLQHVVPLAYDSLEQDEGELAFAGGEDGNEGDDEADAEDRSLGSQDTDEDDENDDEAAARHLHVRSGVLDEKCSALQALGLYAAHTGQAFLQYVEVSMQWALKLADEAWHEDLQVQAVESLPRLVKCVSVGFPATGLPAGQVSQQVQAALAAACPRLLEVLSSYDRAVVTSGIHAWKELLTSFSAGPVAPWLPQVSEIIADVLRDKAPCCEYEVEDEEEEGGGNASDAAEELLAAAADLLPVMVSGVGAAAYAPVLATSHLPALLTRFAAGQPEDSRGVAMGALAEVAERMQEHMTPHLAQLVPILIRELRAADAVNRQNAAFAVGVLVEGCGALASQPFIPQLLQALHPLFGQKEAPGTRDNAVGCLARMITCAPSETPIVPLDAVIPAMCSALPPSEDWNEAAPSYKSLCQLLQNPASLAKIAQHVPAMVACLAAGAAATQLPEATRNVIRETIHGLRAAHQQVVDPLLASLPPSHRTALGL